MIGLIICILIFVVPTVLAFVYNYRQPYNDLEDALMGTFMVGVIALVVAGFLVYPLIAVTGGLMPGYSKGYREGYITKVSQKGIIFKTYEAEMQLGAGKQAALQEPFQFSTSDPDMAEFVEGYIGDRVRVEYTQWLVQPFQEGESGYTIVGILPISD